MKIVKVETESISLPLDEPAFDSTARWNEFNFLLVKVYTDEGIVGLSDIAPLHGKEMGVFEKIILGKLEKRIIGEDPHNIERIWTKMVGFGSEAYALGRSGAIITASSAIDVALWDIVSRSFNTPLYNLLGGKFRDSIELYASFMGQPPVEKVKDFISDGFRGVKVKVGFNVKKDIEYVKMLREELGYDFKLMVDGNQGYTVEEAKFFTKKVEDFEILWFEEPVDVYNFKGLKSLSKSTIIPVALGENYYMLNEFLKVIEENIAMIVQPDINHAGGLTQVRKISSIAESYNIKLAPHLHSIIGFMVGLHLLTASPNGYIAEYPVYGKRWKARDSILEKCLVIDNGIAKIVGEKGIGVEEKFFKL
ncbi:MAG: mandelate racemase/muconate lactonizing enzyme family protein [Nitrososphaeria archaeon]|nr:mandelate racemase/muconate lactonizing enzyme family protein [Nitrososphaeria archaeon]